MSRVVFDIETLALPLDSFDEPSREYLFKFADTEEKVEETKQNLNLHALTSQVIAVALLNPDSSMGKVLLPVGQKGRVLFRGRARAVQVWFGERNF